MPSPTVTHVFFDIGGVLGTNGWDREQRAAAVQRFGLDGEFEHRHHEVVGDWEAGELSFDEYLDVTVFYRPRPFSREEFQVFMFSQSAPFPDSIALARQLRANRRATLMTLNNEAETLNLHRISAFGLQDIFDAFLSSCWLRCRKPSRLIFERALRIAQADPETTLFVDDREQNLAPARALGLRTVQFTGAGPLEAALRDAALL